MLTEQQIEDQKEFERKQISGGLDRLHSNTKKLEEQTYASATCLLYTSPSPRDRTRSRMPSSA